MAKPSYDITSTAKTRRAVRIILSMFQIGAEFTSRNLMKVTGLNQYRIIGAIRRLDHTDCIKKIPQKGKLANRWRLLKKPSWFKPAKDIQKEIKILKAME